MPPNDAVNDSPSDDYPLDRCFLCDGAVLGIEGQDCYLDTYMLNDDDADLDVAGAWGAAHTRCLVESAWGEKWASIFRNRYLRSHASECVYQSAEVGIFREAFFPETHVVRCDGATWSIKDDDLMFRTYVNGGCILLRDEERRWNLHGFAHVATWARNQLSGQGSIPLRDLFQMLAIDRAIMFPEAIASSRLIHVPALEGEWVRAWLSARLQCGIFLPQEIFEAIQSRGIGRMN